MSTGIAVDQPVNAHQDARATRQVLEAVDPVAVVVRLLDAHAAIVAYKLQILDISAGDIECRPATRRPRHGAQWPCAPGSRRGRRAI